jgi:hypothetical protein
MGRIDHVSGLSDVTRFATEIDMKTDPKCLTGIEL